VATRGGAQAERPGRWGWLGLGLVLGAAGGVVYVWVPGQAATPDSASYLEGARHLAAGRGFSTAWVEPGAAAPRPIATFAPGFSLALAAGLRAGASEGASAAWVLGLSYVVYAAGTFLLAVLAAGWDLWALALLATAFALLHPGALLALDRILSDLPFAAWSVLGCCLALRLVAQREPHARWAALLGLWLGTGVLVRWAGMHFLVTTLMAVGVTRAARGRGHWLREPAWMALAAAPVVVAWLARNRVRAGSWTGGREIALGEPLAVLRDAGSGLGAGLVEAPAGWGVALAALLLLAAVVALLRRDRRSPRAPAELFLAVTALGYAGLLVGSSVLHRVDSLASTRFWLPLWPLLGALAVCAVPAARGRARGLAACGVALLLLLPAGRFGVALARALERADEGAIYLSPVIVGSTVLREARAARGCAVLSNNPAALLASASFPSLHRLPRSRAELVRALDDEGSVCIVYFTMSDTRSVEASRPDHRRLIEALAEEGRIRRVARDPVGEFWVSAGSAR
jgi:hypothetical protein